MTPKPQSVCKHCGHGEKHELHRSSADGFWQLDHVFEPVAEPAEPSASPLNNSNFNSNWENISASTLTDGKPHSDHGIPGASPIFNPHKEGIHVEDPADDLETAAPQPVAGEGPEVVAFAHKMCDVRFPMLILHISSRCIQSNVPMPEQIWKLAQGIAKQLGAERNVPMSGLPIMGRDVDNILSSTQDSELTGPLCPKCGEVYCRLVPMRKVPGDTISYQDDGWTKGVECLTCNHRGLKAEFFAGAKVATPASTGEANGWVSVEERLPEPNAAIYFILRETGERHIGKMFDLATSFWSHDFHKFYAPKEVSHWIIRHVPPAPTSVPQAEPPK